MTGTGIRLPFLAHYPFTHSFGSGYGPTSFCPVDMGRVWVLPIKLGKNEPPRLLVSRSRLLPFSPPRCAATRPAAPQSAVAAPVLPGAGRLNGERVLLLSGALHHHRRGTSSSRPAAASSQSSLAQEAVGPGRRRR